MSHSNKENFENKFFKSNIFQGFRNIITAALVGGSAWMSRHRFSEKISELLGSNETRASFEHGLESFAVFVYIRGFEKLFQTENNDSDKKFFLALRIGYSLLLIYYEIQQSIEFSRSLQWEQLISSGLGMVLAQLFSISQENKSK